MNGSGRKSILWILPLLVFAAGCTDPLTQGQDAEPEEVETCERLIPIGIGLVNDYFYALEETDVGAARGNVNLLPPAIKALNARGAELDRRVAELGCDPAELNEVIVDATSGLESDDPVVQAFLETVRTGVATAAADVAVIGEWRFVAGSSLDGGAIEFPPGQTVTLVVDEVGQASGFTGCNDYSIGGIAANGVWPVEGFDVTAAPCDFADVELAYLDAFLVVTEYNAEDVSLTLSGTDVTLSFTKVVSEG